MQNSLDTKSTIIKVGDTLIEQSTSSPIGVTYLKL